MGFLTETARDSLIIEHLPRVWLQARHIQKALPAFVLLDDVYSEGVVGLIQAADEYSPDRGVRFWTFAERRVRGQIFDYLRKLDPNSRQDRHRFKRVEELDDEAAAVELEVDIQEVRALRQRVQAPMTLNALMPVAPRQFRIRHHPSHEPEIIQRHDLDQALSQLPVRTRRFLRLWAYEDLAKTEIAKREGCSAGRVCQLMAGGRKRMREALE